MTRQQGNRTLFIAAVVGLSFQAAIFAQETKPLSPDERQVIEAGLKSFA